MSIKGPDNIVKVVELSIVTDCEIEKTINDVQDHGWFFEDIKFVIREASKRPAMAFLFFYRSRKSADRQGSV